MWYNIKIVERYVGDRIVHDIISTLRDSVDMYIMCQTFATGQN